MIVQSELIKMLDYYNGKSSSLSIPATVYFGLHFDSQPPNPDGTGANEPTSDYVRVPRTTSGFMAAATAGDPTTSVSALGVDSQSVDEGSYSVTWIPVFASPTDTEFIWAFRLDTPVTVVGSGGPVDDIVILAGDVVQEFGKAGETFTE